MPFKKDHAQLCGSDESPFPRLGSQSRSHQLTGALEKQSSSKSFCSFWCMHKKKLGRWGPACKHPGLDSWCSRHGTRGKAESLSEFPCETGCQREGRLWKIKHPHSARMHIAVEIICISFFKAICMSSAWMMPVVSGLGSGAFLTGLWVSWISDASTFHVKLQIQEDLLCRSWGRNPLNYRAALQWCAWGQPETEVLCQVS